MAKIHINSNGEPGACKATVKPCPFGGDETHFSTPQEAEAGYAKAQEVMGNASFGKKNSDRVGQNVVTVDSEDEAIKIANLIANEGKVAAISITSEDWVQGRPDEDDYEDEDEYAEALDHFESLATDGAVEVTEGNRIYQLRAFNSEEEAFDVDPSDWDPNSDFPTTELKLDGQVPMDHNGHDAYVSDVDYDSMRESVKSTMVYFVQPK